MGDFGNDDPRRPWNGPDADNPSKPWNGADRDDPRAPWNDPVGTEEDLEDWK